MLQLDIITLRVAVEFNGYVVVIPTLSLRYKHRSRLGTWHAAAGFN